MSVGEEISVGRVEVCLRVLVEWVGATVFCFFVCFLFFEIQCSTEVKSPTLEPDFLGFEPGFIPNWPCDLGLVT